MGCLKQLLRQLSNASQGGKLQFKINLLQLENLNFSPLAAQMKNVFLTYLLREGQRKLSGILANIDFLQK